MTATTDDPARNGESVPLLASTSDADAQTEAARSSKKVLILVACATLVLAADFGFFLSQAPQTAVFEQIICRDHGLQPRDALSATGHAPGGDPCKSEAVQGELALVLGYKDGLDVLPSMSTWDLK